MTTAPDSPIALRFIQARHYRAARITAPSVVVLHDMEAVESNVTALHVAQWFGGASAPMASAHYCVDCDEVIQSVREADEAYAAPGANAQGIHIELAGYARQSEADWEADAPLLNRAAELVADICRRHGVPAVFVDAAGLLAGAVGITTHAEVAKAWRKTDHTDPGPHFPLEHFLRLVGECIDGAGDTEPAGRPSTLPPPDAPEPPTLRNTGGHEMPRG